MVSAVPEDTSALADRLGRYLSQDTEPVSQELGEGLKGRAARRARAERVAERAAAGRCSTRSAPGRAWGVTLGGVDLSAARLADVRRRILVSDSGSQLFAGTLQDAVDPHGRLTREQAEEALRVANAEDVYDALPGGWQGRLDERGRGLSGGQRQRVVLARASLAQDADILVLVEPTSAVDAHTEARIAERVADVRRGRTTVVTTVSPLWLHHADRIVLVQGDRAIAEGTHEDLLLDSPDVPPRGHPGDGRRTTEEVEVAPWLTCSPPLRTPGATAPPSRPVIPPELVPPQDGLLHRPRHGPAPPPRPARAPGAGELRRSPASPSAAGRSPTTRRCCTSSARCCASASGSSCCWSSSTAWRPRPASSCRACSAP